MSWFTKALSGPIGQKILMALSGLFLISFLCIHLTGNLLLLLHDPGSFNTFVDVMEGNPIIGAMEYILFGGFFLHIIYSIVITLKNRAARPVKYAVTAPAANSTWFSRNMGLSGTMIFIFLVIHLNTFFIGAKITHTETRTFHDVAIASFANPLYVSFYVFAMILLAFHLNHGFQSAFQTLGLRHPKYTPIIKGLGLAFSVIVPFLFALIPVMILCTR